jgi:hypothetical protein
VISVKKAYEEPVVVTVVEPTEKAAWITCVCFCGSAY